MCGQRQDAFFLSYFWCRDFWRVVLPLTTLPPPLAVMRLRWAAQNGAARPLAWGSAHSSRPPGMEEAPPRRHPTARSPPQPVFLRLPQPSPAKQGFLSAPHTHEACPFSRAQPERGARRDPEEKCITILLVLHSSFPHSAWCSTAIPQIKINKINVLLK